MKKVELYIVDLSKDNAITFGLSKKDMKKIDMQKAVSNFLKQMFVGDYSFNEHGKPISDKVHFNISHSNDYVVIALADVDVGADIEMIDRPYKQNMIDFICSEEEKPLIKDNESFYKVWTSKESLIKCLGIGLSINLKSVPALPFEGAKIFQNQSFFTKQIKLANYQLSLTIAGNSDFEIVTKELN